MLVKTSSVVAISLESRLLKRLLNMITLKINKLKNVKIIHSTCLVIFNHILSNFLYIKINTTIE